MRPSPLRNLIESTSLEGMIVERSSIMYRSFAADCALVTSFSTICKWFLFQHDSSIDFFLSFDRIHAYLYRLRCSIYSFSTFQQFKDDAPHCHQYSELNS